MIDFDRSFASSPKAEFWSDINEKTPCEVSKNSHKKFWFICGECGHSFDIQLDKVTAGIWCPFCVNRRLCEEDCTQCYEKSFASKPRAEFWDYIKNEKTPREVTKSCNKKFWFICSECEHSFETSLNSVTKGRWCPYCAKPSRRLCEEDCTQCLEKSFANHPKAGYWSGINEKKPREVFKNSHTKFWFNCSVCTHSFETSLNSVTTSCRWCPYCANPSRKLCEVMNCVQCLEKSFASSPRVEFWDYNKNIKKKPREVFKSSHEKFRFNCGGCDHSFDSTLNHVTKGTWCPYCVSKKLCDKDCTQCREKSFASSQRAVFWDHIKNEKTPRDVFKGSETKVWFNCGKHSFETTLASVTTGTWCPKCVNKTEQKFLDWFEAKYNHLVINHQAKYDWCKDKLHLPFDFSIESLKLIIEIDGPQHYRQISNWQSPEITQARDKYKTQMALENGYTVIRILQEDIFKNVVGWEDELVELLK